MIELPFCDEKFKDIPCVITIGVFDGVHIGHLEILKECVSVARNLGVKSVVITFSNNPKMFCGREEYSEPIISLAERDKIFADLGFDYHCVIDFSEHISKISGEEFIAKLCTLYNIKAMVVGSDFKCGNKNSFVDCNCIKSLLTRFTSSAFLKVVTPVLFEGEVVSSSLIRRCLLTGDFEKVSKLLGRAYIPH